MSATAAASNGLGIWSPTARPTNIVARPGRVDIVMTRGDDLVLRLAVRDDKGNPIDMTGVTVRGHIRETIDAPTVLEDLIFCGVQANNVYVRISSAMSTDLPDHSVYDVEVTRDYDVLDCPGPFLLTYIGGRLTLEPEVTR